ncbi:hypothetical protein MUG84_00090 [Paenibacillus sp. KQZ6P-2]|uniref:Uncharacterized protein n=1 Tax=Paenibacillus mangrovi TaxID=2931978 RepID=A0A9X2B056_9BACL|nr:hypothetical protein [Paenibacillus mangrovi]MCJ8010139.1 hypothetical protein [Paenibacillus mangrovi]
MLLNFLIIVGVASVLYPMRNLLGLITRFCIYGMIIWTLFFNPPMPWDSKILFVAILFIPIVVNWIYKFLKRKLNNKLEM